MKLTPDGKVKVLDFGLAKAWTGDAASGSSADLSQSPTLAHTGTAAGIILGTAAYMSPEQARGKAVDKRADIWAFGVVLFEMLTGRRLFDGETVTDVLAAVVRQEIDWDALPPGTPAGVRRLLRRCLDRDPRQPPARHRRGARRPRARRVRGGPGRGRGREGPGPGISPWVAVLGGVLAMLAGSRRGPDGAADREDPGAAAGPVRARHRPAPAELLLAPVRRARRLPRRAAPGLGRLRRDGRAALPEEDGLARRRERSRRRRERRIPSSPPTGRGSASSPTAC